MLLPFVLLGHTCIHPGFVCLLALRGCSHRGNSQYNYTSRLPSDEILGYLALVLYYSGTSHLPIDRAGALLLPSALKIRHDSPRCSPGHAVIPARAKRSGVEGSALKIHAAHPPPVATRVSSRPESAAADAVEGSAVAFSWFRAEHPAIPLDLLRNNPGILHI